MARIAAGVGFVDDPNSFEAGKQAASRAVEHSGATAWSLALGFCTGRHDHQACLEGIRSAVGQTPIIGGSSIGIVTNGMLGYEGYETGVALLPDDLAFALATVGDLDRDERNAGFRLGEQLAPHRNPAEQATLLFYDSVQSPPPPAPVLNVSSYLLDGFVSGLGAAPPPIVGAGLLGRYTFELGHLFCGDRVGEQCATAALLTGDCHVHTSIMHGCEPISDYHTITRIEGPVVYEIDHRPALEVIDDLLGDREWQERLPLLLVTLGVNHGEKYGPYDEESYVSRLIVGIVPEERAIVLFEADFESGTEFQFMRRNDQLMAASAEAGCVAALEQVREGGREPFFALYIDCAGRSAAFSGTDEEEASIVQRILGPDLPLLGLYSGVEIAPLLGQSRGLDWTGVLMLLCRGE